MVTSGPGRVIESGAFSGSSSIGTAAGSTFSGKSGADGSLKTSSCLTTSARAVSTNGGGLDDPAAPESFGDGSMTSASASGRESAGAGSCERLSDRRFLLLLPPEPDEVDRELPLLAFSSLSGIVGFLTLFFALEAAASHEESASNVRVAIPATGSGTTAHAAAPAELAGWALIATSSAKASFNCASRASSGG